MSCSLVGRWTVKLQWSRGVKMFAGGRGGETIGVSTCAGGGFTRLFP